MNSGITNIRRFSIFTIFTLFIAFVPFARAKSAEFEAKPDDPFFAKFNPRKAPINEGPFLQAGDRLAICGDSITEQKMYSRIMETYLAVCVPQLKIEVRQYGWSGETAEGFLGRMTNDCLRFKPTIATTCYGMNDYKYRPFDEANGRWYHDKYTAVVHAFTASGARVVLGTAGCVGKVASWVKSASGTLEEHNLSLCMLRDIDIDIAAQEHVRFADVFWPMFTSAFAARQKYGPAYNVAGRDGVHPDWAGHLIMAYVYLRALGLNGDLGTFTVDLAGGTATATEGHQVNGFKDGTLNVTSTRYPFCASGALDKDNSIRSGMTLVPFNPDLNRMTLIVKGATAEKYKVTWGETSRTYTGAELGKGVNLADDFAVNPFSPAFAKVDAAVSAKQAYESKQIKQIFHGPEGNANMEAAVQKTEAERAVLAAAVQAAVVPVTHTIRIEAQ